MPLAIESILSFHSTLGAVSVGFSIACVVFGIFTTQVVVYYKRYFLDKAAYKFLVTSLWLLELVDQVFIGYSVYFYTITHYGSPLVLVKENVIWTLIVNGMLLVPVIAVQIAMGSLVGTIVKICFALRVWRFSHKNIPVTGAIMVMVIAHSGLSVAYIVKAFKLNKIIYADRLRLIASLSLGANVLTDALIAAALCFFLRRLRTGYRKSDTLVNTLSVYAINTGALTSAVSLVTLILYNTSPTSFYYMASYFVLGKVYAISFLCTLNTRRVIRGKGTDREATTNNTDNIRNTFFMVTQPRRTVTVPELGYTKSMEIGIHQEVSIITDLDEEAAVSIDNSRSMAYDLRNH